jgi:gamma-glutamylputrescine oxidase
MNLLHANDRRGAYPASWYAATTLPLPPFPALKGAAHADVVVVGGGYTGLSAALHLAERGYDVVLLDAHRVGWGASGRNGGQLGSGQRLDQFKLEKLVGKAAALRLWQLGEEAKQVTHGLIDAHRIDCGYRPGLVWAGFTPRDTDQLARYADHLNREYGYTAIAALGPQALQAICPSPAYHGGMLDQGAGHLHPLRFALGLARAAAAAGVRVHEHSEVHRIDRGTRAGAQVRVATDAGHVEADHLILAANGYLGGLDRKVAARVMPINNFIVATEPLGARVADVLRRDVAVSDARFVVNYFRLTDDNRLLFGGGETYGYRFPADIAALVRKPMLDIFPSLRDVRIDHAWGGTLAITQHRLPYFARLAPNVLTASGYSGHGIGTATHAGLLLAEAVAGQAERFDVMAALPVQPFPGGTAMRAPVLALAMIWFSLRDRLGI